MTQRNYVGLASTGHDNALAIVDSQGKLVFAEASERYLQNKRSYSSPPDDMLRVGKLIEQYCDPGADIVIAKTWSENTSTVFKHESAAAAEVLAGSLHEPEAWRQLFEIYIGAMQLFGPPIESAGTNLSFYCAAHPQRQAQVRRYEHHYVHAATGCFTSPFKDALCAVVDGFGEGRALSFYRYQDGRIKTLDGDYAPLEGMRSLGLFYGPILCGLCGFNVWEGEEWKVMGLAPYGEFDDAIYKVMERFMDVDGLHIKFNEHAPEACAELFEYGRKPGASALSVANLAYTGQQFFSDVMTQLLDNLYEYGGSDNLVLGGGCALNSSYAGRILERTKFKKLHIYSAPADDGNAVGAALLAYYQDHQQARPQPGFSSPYLGSEVSSKTVDRLIKYSRINKVAKRPRDDIYQRTAAALAEGKIVAWLQGRAEFGPRALGNRSILADPRDPCMKDTINSLVKFREEFRPFAPSILHEYGDEYFINYQETPYMERTLVFKEKVRDKVPAVVHEDNTGRLQTVKQAWNAPYYQLISEFNRLTGVPVLLNTSLNVMGKPIVHSVEDAIALFYTTGVDVLVIEDCFIEK